ncbi:DNA mismatch repair protein msh6 [Agyrium rufum]|nr:DNA mismatch repair protein msh6 [Agyrium rufum]
MPGVKSSPTGSVQPPSLQKSSSVSKTAANQKSILGFFQKRAVDPTCNGDKSSTKGASSNASSPFTSSAKTCVQNHPRPSIPNLTPFPSSDAIEADTESESVSLPSRLGAKPLPSPITPASMLLCEDEPMKDVQFSSPSRRAKKVVSYVESEAEEDDEEDAFNPTSAPKRGRILKRKRTLPSSDSEDVYGNNENDAELSEEDDFIVPDDSDDTLPTKKRKRGTTAKLAKPIRLPSYESTDDLEIPTVSTAQQWKYDADNVQPLQPRPVNAATRKPNPTGKPYKEKAHHTEPDQRYPWLAKITDADRNPPDHPEYDPRTVFIPPHAWQKFSPFEKQYWEIKQKFWDTIVFFKKGKFYELYENDATIGHQLFDLKLTDRVNMRMVGVPEMSLDHWANQFVAKGYKIARVDQKETALGKQMRERDNQDGKASKVDKVITRELACVLTAGTLVDGGMLQDDLSTYCVAIKESVVDERPAFGIAFVDAATGHFSLAEFIDDLEMTRFETFVAQTRPQELLLERSSISVKALRILKNNTGPTTIWNYLKAGKEFWSADIARREFDAAEYFVQEDGDNIDAWPPALREAREKDLVMSALGALTQYLRQLQIERDLLTMGNFTWYDPIRKASSLVLDGQTLINLEIFANSFDGSTEGTLFTLLNRCITPFGKRMFKQWVCHPLVDSDKINARLDAVDALNTDTTIRDRFASQMSKMPDLERLISRIHAGVCKGQDFLRVLEGFEQIEYTLSLMGQFEGGDGLIGQLMRAMPDLKTTVEPWKTAFDRPKAKDTGLLVPEPGVEEDFDASQNIIEDILAQLQKYLKSVRKELGSNVIEFRDNGKEIYQLEVPVKVKGIPSSWQQMSATQKVKRYYSKELKDLVRQLQEAQETHSQIVKEVAARFYARFDEDYATWLASVRIIAQLDCLVGLSKASAALGEPSCRPQFIDEERSVLEFEELRHPCVLPNVADFIPNDIKLGGESQNINLLTGANAAGKSTVLRMTCTAVIMAQIGCYVPCYSARLTPVDRIMSRLGANDNIFAAQSTFFVELSETKKILSEATPRSLVILDELGRGTSSYDGVAVAQSVLHHVATHIGCIGFFATHYHSLAEEFIGHPEIRNKRMQIHVDKGERRVTFLYKLEDGVAEGSFGMHCAAMCGIPLKVIESAEQAAAEWEHTSRLKDGLHKARMGCYVPLGMQSDVAWMLKDILGNEGGVENRGIEVLRKAIEEL